MKEAAVLIERQKDLLFTQDLHPLALHTAGHGGLNGATDSNVAFWLILPISLVERQRAVRLQAPCPQPVPVKDLMPPGKPLLFACPGTVDIGVEAVIAVGDNRVVRVVRRGIGNAARARRAF